MKYIYKHGYNISRFSLGTAQFGSDYGIANKHGKVAEKEIEKIFNKAFEKGVNLIDTAVSYGESERIIGKILSNSSYKEDIIIASKLPHLKSKNNLQGITKEIDQVVDQSLSHLRLETLPIFLLHEEEDLFFDGGYIVDVLKNEKERGKINLLGVSAYSPEAAEAALENPEMQVIQVPFNLFDQRLNKINFFSRAAEKGKLVLVRSVFLQGLFFMTEDEILPEKFCIYSPYFKKLSEIADSYCFRVGELALKYACQKSQGSVILGVDSCTQLDENLDAYSNKNILNSEIIKSIEKAFQDIPVNLIDPRMWC